MFERMRASGLRLRDLIAGGLEPSEGFKSFESRGSAREGGARTSAFPFSLFHRWRSSRRLTKLEAAYVIYNIDKLKKTLLEVGDVIKFLSDERRLIYVYWAIYYYGFGWVVKHTPESFWGMMVWKLYQQAAPKIVECKNCEKRVKSVIPIFGHKHQGIDCACAIVMEECEPCGTGKHYYLEGAYGSSHFDDFEIRYAFKGEPPEKLLRNGGNPICDECVQKMIDDGRLIPVRPRTYS